MNFNKHIQDYLNYYIQLDEPGFAVLLKGEWGSGKSWFINGFANSEESSIKYLKISLFGVTTFSEIDELFFQQLHPILSSTKVRLAGKVLKGLLKATIKVDLDGDKKEDVVISPNLPEINLPDYLKNAKEKVIIFDDLERCNIPIENLLGYINQLVEVQGQKVILLANEKELISKLGSDAIHYLSTKEKIISRSFTVVSNFDAAVFSFLSEITNDRVRDILSEDDYEILRKYFITSSYNNLRHLRQGILDFARFYTFLPETAITKKDLLNHIVELFFAITFELKKGFLKEEDLTQLFGIDALALRNNEEKTNPQKIRSKYQVFSHYTHPISAYSWLDYFVNGRVNIEELKSSIENSEYFEENRASWIKLWSWSYLDDQEFKYLSSIVTNELKTNSLTNQFEILHVAGLLMTLADMNFIKIKKKTILRYSVKSLKTLAKKLELHPDDSFHDHHYGRAYQGKELQEFIQLKTEYINIISKSKKSQHLEEAQNLLEVLKTSTEDFSERITLTNSRKNLYYNLPILTYIRESDFINVVDELSNKEKELLAWALERRYSIPQLNLSLKEELPWLNNVKGKLELRKKSMGKIASYNTTHIISELEKAIGILNNT